MLPKESYWGGMKSLSTDVLLKKEQERSGEECSGRSTIAWLFSHQIGTLTNNLVCNSRGSIHRLQCEWCPWGYMTGDPASGSFFKLFTVQSKRRCQSDSSLSKSWTTAAFLLRTPRQIRKATRRGTLWLWPVYCSGQMVWQMLCTSVVSWSACQLVQGILSFPEGTHQTLE